MIDETYCNSSLIIDLDKLVRNMHSMQKDMGEGVTIIPVLKCNAYGLGAIPIAKALTARAGARYLAVAQVCEGVELRRAGLNAPEIFVLGGVPESLFASAVQYNVGLALFCPATALALEHEAARQDKIFPVQLKIETGLNRAGVKPGEALAELLHVVKNCRHLRVTGVFTHFAEGEIAGSAFSLEQYAKFEQAVAQMKAVGINPPLQHICASGSTDWFRGALCNAVRIGRRLYMDSQSAPLPQGTPGAIEEVASWRTSVVNLRTVQAGDTIGYDRAFVAPRRMRVATLCVGYGDGLYVPYVEKQGPVLIGGCRAHFIGTCMDQSFVDVTDIPCRVGDEATLFGTSSCGAYLSAQETSRWITNEGVFFTSLLSARVARVYLGAQA